MEIEQKINEQNQQEFEEQRIGPDQQHEVEHNYDDFSISIDGMTEEGKYIYFNI